MECKVSKIYKGIYTHLLFFFMSLSLGECKGYGFLEREGQRWKGIRHNLIVSSFLKMRILQSKEVMGIA